MEEPQARSGDLLALAIPPGPRFAEALSDAWDRGVAVLPLDPRLPARAAEDLISRARPFGVLSPDGMQRLPDPLPVDPDIGLVVATSGTEGEPRLVELPRQALIAAIEASREALDAPSDARWLCCLPTAHVGGLLVLLRAALGGTTAVVLPRFEADAVIASDASFTAVVPTMLRRLVDARAPLDSFEAILVGGAGLDAELRRRAEELGAHMVETYGLTESCGGVVYDGAALRGVEVSLREDGRIALGGPTLFRRYRDDQEATAQALDPDGKLVTRDIGTIDANGRLHVLGRSDDAIVTGGETVHPAAVEAVLSRHPSVSEVAVIGEPDAEWGERIAAVVVPRGAPPRLEDLRTFALETLPTWAAPRSLILRDELPRTASGKVRRSELRSELRSALRSASPEGSREQPA